jgi:2-keto-4-pentenoate hydratase
VSKPSEGPDLTVAENLPEVEYSEEALEVIQQMIYRFPNCAGCPPKIG